METSRKYLLVGLFILIIIAAGIFFTLWLTFAGKGEYVYYRMRFSESVSGLNKEGKVKFRGVDVGNIKEIIIDPDDIKRIRVDIRILKSTPIKKDTQAILKLHGITGDVYIDLTGGNPDAPNLSVSAKDEIPEIKTEQSGINILVNRTPQIIEKTNHIVDQISKMFSDENVESISSIIKRLEMRLD